MLLIQLMNLQQIYASLEDDQFPLVNFHFHVLNDYLLNENRQVVFDNLIPV